MYSKVGTQSLCFITTVQPNRMSTHLTTCELSDPQKQQLACKCRERENHTQWNVIKVDFNVAKIAVHELWAERGNNLKLT